MGETKKFTKGQKVAYTQVLNSGESIFEGEVLSVGKKYITIQGRLEKIKFHADTLREAVNYGLAGDLYSSIDEYNNEKLLDKRISTILRTIEGKQGITLEQASKIMDILGLED